jgi:hypothetical protein
MSAKVVVKSLFKFMISVNLIVEMIALIGCLALIS